MFIMHNKENLTTNHDSWFLDYLETHRSGMMLVRWFSVIKPSSDLTNNRLVRHRLVRWVYDDNLTVTEPAHISSCQFYSGMRVTDDISQASACNSRSDFFVGLWSSKVPSSLVRIRWISPQVHARSCEVCCLLRRTPSPPKHSSLYASTILWPDGFHDEVAMSSVFDYQNAFVHGADMSEANNSMASSCRCVVVVRSSLRSESGWAGLKICNRNTNLLIHNRGIKRYCDICSLQIFLLLVLCRRCTWCLDVGRVAS